MALVRLEDRELIEAWLRRDPAMHLYELGDLDDFFWPHTSWYGLEEAGGDPRAIALIYKATDLPVLVVLGRDGERRAGQALLAALGPMLPERFYAHLMPGIIDALGAPVRIEPHGLHERMVLVDRTLVDAVDTSSACALGAGERGEVLALYRNAYPANWFDPRMLETGTYFGARRRGVLVSIAGVHVVSRRYRVAALGNVATDPSARGLGLARVVTAAVCKSLAGIDPIGLNVESTNAAAIRVYHTLGFERISSYDEVLVTRV